MSNKCKTCRSSEPPMMITMSEANWERHEYAHARDKKALFVALIISTVLLILSNIGWVYHEFNDSYKEIEVTKNETPEDCGL